MLSESSDGLGVMLIFFQIVSFHHGTTQDTIGKVVGSGNITLFISLNRFVSVSGFVRIKSFSTFSVSYCIFSVSNSSCAESAKAMMVTSPIRTDV